MTNGDLTKEEQYYELTLNEWYNRLALIKDVQDEHAERMERLKHEMQSKR